MRNAKAATELWEPVVGEPAPLAGVDSEPEAGFGLEADSEPRAGSGLAEADGMES